MKFRNEVTPDKLRGGYYTPRSVVELCYQRVFPLLSGVGKRRIRLLEPAAGDGAFVRWIPGGVARRLDITAIEIQPEAAEACAEACRLHLKARWTVRDVDFFEWLLGNPRDTFDVIVGNPPFVRYQFVLPESRATIEHALGTAAAELAGVSNLWIPFLTACLGRLLPGGVIAMVVPAEMFSTVSAANTRQLLLSLLEDLQVDIFRKSTFPDILQDIVVVSGRRRSGRVQDGTIGFVEHHIGDKRTTWRHQVPVSGKAWMEYLLTDTERRALKDASAQRHVYEFSSLARMQVAIVTGANRFFTVRQSTVDEYELAPWARPLLARTGDTCGIVVGKRDHAAAVEQDRRSWLLDFSGGPELGTSAGALRYMRVGKRQKLHERYKCRIRSPWYCVPDIRAGRLMMTKRSHQHPRLLLNSSQLLTTDTIYRGNMLPEHQDHERDLVAGFHNSLTLLSAEIEGRTYGGGVLELVPSEIRRLRIPLATLGCRLEQLDSLSRSSNGQLDRGDTLVQATNDALITIRPDLAEYIGVLEDARVRLRSRRFGETQGEKTGAA